MSTDHLAKGLALSKDRRPIKLSIAVITYNHGSFIRQALESVLAQQVNFPYEIVIAEDCSTDNTRAIVMEFCQQHSENIIPIFQERNVGMMRNLSSALATCRGEYVALLEGDDYWICAKKLQRQVDFLDRDPEYAICCHRVRMVDETGAGRNEIWPSRKAGSYSIRELILENFLPNCSAVMYRSACLSAFPDWFFDFEFCDWPLHILVSRSGKIRLFDDVMGVYRLHARSLYSSRQGASRKDIMIPMFKALDRHLNFQYTDLISEAIATFYFDMAIMERLNGNRLATLAFLTASVRNGKLRMAGRWRSIRALLVYSLFGYKPR
jgi:glycosyltransferase involved in cell wall biosynthesis